MFFKKEDGQAMVEFALVLPILLLFLCGIIDFGWVFGNQLAANNATREATRYEVVNYNAATADTDVTTKITEQLPSGIFSGIAVDVTQSGEEINVVFNGDIKILTPFLSTLRGGATTYTVQSDCTMRVE